MDFDWQQMHGEAARQLVAPLVGSSLGAMAKASKNQSLRTPNSICDDGATTWRRHRRCRCRFQPRSLRQRLGAATHHREAMAGCQGEAEDASWVLISKAFWAGADCLHRSRKKEHRGAPGIAS